jgi:CMP-N-acetylneuraminic acid synthetase
VLSVVVLELNLRKAYTYQNGNQKPLIEQQAMKWPKQNGQTL